MFSFLTYPLFEFYFILFCPSPFQFLRIYSDMQDAEYDPMMDIIHAARHNDIELLRSLSTHPSFSPSTPCEYTGNTPLHYASANNHLPIVAYLLSLSHPVSPVNNDGNTPLHWAALNGHLDIVGALLAGGADAAARNKGGRSPGTLAEQQDFMEIANLLLKAYEPGGSDDPVDKGEVEKMAKSVEGQQHEEGDKVEEDLVRKVEATGLVDR
jgi:hypothetical protein